MASHNAPPFMERLRPAPRNGGFRMPGYCIWGGSVLRDDLPGGDGLYHMFASRWPAGFPAHPHWLTNCEIVHAVSKTPEGPYHFKEVALKPRGGDIWDNGTVTNPTLHRCGDHYLLFYTGARWDHAKPDPADPATWLNLKTQFDSRYIPAWNSKRIGLAVSSTLSGPWIRRDAPLLEPRPGEWDAMNTTNPAPWIDPAGRVCLVYKSRPSTPGDERMMLGMAMADEPAGPYRQRSNAPLFTFENPKQHVEDPFLWHERGTFRLLMKDMTGGLVDEIGAGVEAESSDGWNWRIRKPAKAWSRQIPRDDGQMSHLAVLERPQLLMGPGESGPTPTHLFAASAEGPGFWDFEASSNLCIPLSPTP